MRIYAVGGSVRDELLGLTPLDRDYLVVGATEGSFLEKFPGAKKVGKSFPVFLVEGDEYAFARTEHSIGVGHRDFEVSFSPKTTLVEDLLRRDLTINALARDLDTGELLGDSRGLKDLRDKVLRHVGGAFKEDPLRVFRVARFAAQMPEFSIAPETLKVMDSMKLELCHLPAERVFREMEKALSSKRPRAFFEALKEVGGLDYWLPEVAALVGIKAGPEIGKHAGECDTFEHTLNVIDKTPGRDPVLKFSSMCHDLGKALSENPPSHIGHDSAGAEPVKSLCNRLKTPKIYRQSAALFCKQHIRMHNVEEMRPGKAVNLVIEVQRGMHLGLVGFLSCSVGDAMPPAQMYRVLDRSAPVFAVRLPPTHIGKGAACAEILLGERAKAWKVGKGGTT